MSGERLQRTLTWLVVLGAIATSTACTEDGNPSGGAPNESDPQVVQDVVDTVLMVPGPSQRRAIRLSVFIQNLTVTACGAEPIPLDSTVDRFMQQTFPDLDLIRSRGLVERRPEPVGETGDEECDISSSGVEERLPSRVDAMELIQPWLDLVSTTQQDPGLTSLKQPMWECMTDRTALPVGQDVPTDFLAAANVSLSDGRGDDDAKMSEYSVVYADCSETYFDRLQELLLVERPAVVERNRELLERYASELIAAGYAP